MDGVRGEDAEVGVATTSLTTRPEIEPSILVGVTRAVDRFVAAGAERSVAAALLPGPSWITGAAERRRRPLASLLKVAVVMAAADGFATAGLDPDRPVIARDLPTSRHPALLDVLDDGHAFTLREVCGLALVTSDNPLAQHVLEVVGADAVADLLTRLGCHDTDLAAGFTDADLDHAARASTGTAPDCVRLLAAIDAEPRYEVVRTALARTVQSRRLTRLLRRPDGPPTAHKTGSLSGVCNDMAIVGGGSTRLAVAVLCDAEDDVGRADLDCGALGASLWDAVGDALR